jgi:molecular chaperone GrpE
MNEERNRHKARNPGTAAVPPDTEQLQEETGSPGPEIEQLRTQLAEVQKTADTLKDQLLRKAADFENFRKRAEAEFAAVIRNANESLLLALIPTLDDFLRSLKSGKDQKDYDAFYRGVELICSKFSRTLENEGLVPFESVGKPFDVRFHDALLQIPRRDVPPHTVVEEVERGFMLNDRVLRHAKVVVSSAPEVPDESVPKPNNGAEKEGND